MTPVVTRSASDSVASTAPRIDIGISAGDRKQIAEDLSRFLVNACTLRATW